MKPGYKQTDVGVIPEEWEVKRLYEVVDLQVGFAFKSDWFGTHIGTRLLRGENVGYGSADWSDTRTLEGKQEGGFRSYLLNPGDVVIGMDRTFTKTGSKITLISEGDCPCLLVQRVGRFVPRKCDQSFLWFVLSSETVQSRLRLEQKGMDIPHLSRSEILHPFAIFPPPPEQRAIAMALSDVDGLLGGLDRLIAKKRELKQAAMQQLLTGQTRLPGFHGEWEVKRLEELGSTYGGLTGKTKADFGEGSARYITFMNIMSNVVIDCGTFEQVQVSPTESQNRAMKGDLFFNGSSETPEEVAMCAVLLDEVHNVYLNSFCFGFRFREAAEADGLFLAYYLRSREGRELMKSLAQGSTRYNLSKVALLKSPLRLPALPEQTAIAEVLTEMDAELAGLEQRREKTRALKQAMMQELLTGRTRLV